MSGSTARSSVVLVSSSSIAMVHLADAIRLWCVRPRSSVLRDSGASAAASSDPRRSRQLVRV
jgi:hypothetical protein